MTIYPLKEKSIEMLKHPARHKVLEGSVRSAKTLTANIDFYKNVLFSGDNVFLISGYTQGSVARNVILGDFGLIALSRNKIKQKTDPTSGMKCLDINGKIVYYVGADDAAAFKTIRGMTIGGWYADEVNLQHKDFIENAEGRMFAAKNPFTIWTMNADLPAHWIYEERIDKYINNNLPNFFYQHYTLHDNPAINEERMREIEQKYTGVFYQRYVLGQRVRAEGICYPSFSEKNILNKLPDNILYIQIGSDVGGNKSATCFSATAFFLNEDKEICTCLIDEIRDAKNKNTESVINNFKEFVMRNQNRYDRNGEKINCISAYTDSAEQLMKKSFDELGIINVYNSVKTRIIDRIRFLDLAFARNRFFVMNYCGETIKALKSSVFDEKCRTEERRLDDGKMNIDSIDAYEYGWTSEQEYIIL